VCFFANLALALNATSDDKALQCLDNKNDSHVLPGIVTKSQVVDPVGLEPDNLDKIQPQNSLKFSKCPQIGAQTKCLAAFDKDLLELLKLWPFLSDDDKEIILMVARKGGRK
jgi:hypothetical protein